MKGFLAFLLIIVLLGTGLFFWLLSHAGADDAPKEIVTIQIEDNFEK